MASNTDCDDADAGIYPGALEVCDGIDNDCDRDVDDSAIDADEYYSDADGDGFGDASTEVSACDAPEAHVRDATDCDDADPSVHPDAEEFCDGLDNDCDGSTDEASAFDASVWYTDGDGDGFGDGTPTIACDAPAGSVTVDGDCDDGDSLINPDVDELCDGLDNDCDGDTDESSATDAETFYRDMDGDGWGDTAMTMASCDLPAGFVETPGDCNDAEAADYPGAVEVCDGRDNDCDSSTSEDDSADASIWYVDMDGDGYGSDASTTMACSLPAGHADNADDCHDGSMLAYPGGTEICDGLDNDCNGEIDGADAEDVTAWYMDADGDGFGDAGYSEVSCDAPLGFIAEATDCDDDSPEAYPGGVEVCDGLDNDCNGETDEIDGCSCDLSSIATPDYYVSADGTHGAWMQDPLETLGSGLIWEMPSYSGESIVYVYDGISDMTARTLSSSEYLAYGYDGTGHVVYDGYLYYNQSGSNTLRKVDLATMSDVGSLYVPEAGYRNTYAYQWGGYSDIDLAVDEDGLWVIYGTAANGGRLVLSKIDIDSFTITDTWNTGSDNKNSIGNAFMICGKLYATNSYSSSSATVNFKFDPETGEETNPGITIENPGGYNSSIDYNPLEQRLYSWDSSRRQTYDLTLE